MLRSRMRRVPWSMTVAGICLLLAVAPGPLAGPAGAQGRDDPPLDLAAMTLRPADLEAQGLDDYGMSWSVMGANSRTVAEFVDAWGWDDAVDDGMAFREADADRSYLLHISQDVESNGWVYSPHLVASFVLEYDDADAAEEGFAASVEVWDNTLEVTDAEIDIGDEQVLIAGTGTDTSNSERYERMLLLYRVDNLVSGVSMHDFANEDAPTQEVVEALAETQAGHIAAAIDGDAPGLSGQVVRFRLDGRLSNWDYYTAEADQAVRLNTVDESDDEYAERQAEYEELGLVDRYHLEQIVAEESPAGAVYAWFNATIDRFESEDAASEFLVNVIEDDGTAEMVNAPDLGDETVAYTSVTPSGNDRYRIMVRTGDIVFRLTHVVDTDAAGNTLEPAPDAINDLAERQLACIEGERSCERPVRLPDEMQAGASDTGRQDASIVPLMPVLARREW